MAVFDLDLCPSPSFLNLDYLDLLSLLQTCQARSHFRTSHLQCPRSETPLSQPGRSSAQMRLIHKGFSDHPSSSSMPFCIGSVSLPCFIFFVTFITTRDSYLYVRLLICYLSHKIKYKLDDGREMHSLHFSPGGGK